MKNIETLPVHWQMSGKCGCLRGTFLVVRTPDLSILRIVILPHRRGYQGFFAQ